MKTAEEQVRSDLERAKEKLRTTCAPSNASEYIIDKINDGLEYLDLVKFYDRFSGWYKEDRLETEEGKELFRTGRAVK